MKKIVASLLLAGALVTTSLSVSAAEITTEAVTTTATKLGESLKGGVKLNELYGIINDSGLLKTVGIEKLDTQVVKSYCNNTELLNLVGLEKIDTKQFKAALKDDRVRKVLVEACDAVKNGKGLGDIATKIVNNADVKTYFNKVTGKDLATVLETYNFDTIKGYLDGGLDNIVTIANTIISSNADVPAMAKAALALIKK